MATGWALLRAVLVLSRSTHGSTVSTGRRCSVRLYVCDLGSLPVAYLYHYVTAEKKLVAPIIPKIKSPEDISNFDDYPDDDDVPHYIDNGKCQWFSRVVVVVVVVVVFMPAALACVWRCLVACGLTVVPSVYLCQALTGTLTSKRTA